MYIVQFLPSEIQEIIWSYIGNNTKVWLNKYYYEKYHNSLILVNIPDLHKYINYIVIKKHNYIFRIIYRDRYLNWQRHSKINYTNLFFTNYEEYIKYISQKYENNYINELIKERQRGKTQFKEKKKYLSWRN